MAPSIISSVSEMQRFSDEARRQGKRIGVVPTMGALHEGHLSLIRIAAEMSNVVICTLFVNPTQFGPNEDFERYPRSPEEDMRKAGGAGATVFFAPSVKEMYAEGHQTYVVNTSIAEMLEGKERPGHFRGVVTVVLKLLTATKPHVAVFGQKDAQQLAVVRAMVRDLGLDVRIVAGPIVREPDGLAMSSRNVYLDAGQRKQAASLNRALTKARDLVYGGTRNVGSVLSEVRKEIQAAGPDAIDYLEAVDPDTFEQVTEVREAGTLIVLAVRFGKTRLLDNIILQ